MKLVAGLGNVGKSYQLTRHNIGFMIVDSLGKDSWTTKKSQFSLIQKITFDSEVVLLSKPQTQMNLSGKAVVALMNYYNIQKEDLLVIQDDVDLKFGSMKFQNARGDGGHNGIKNIHECLGHSSYYRLKLGIGKPSDNLFEKTNSDPFHFHSKQTPSYVLSPFSQKQFDQLEKFILRACEAVQTFVLKGGVQASNQYNQKTHP